MKKKTKKRIILLATQPNLSIEDKKTLLNLVYLSVKDKDVFLIVKKHPREKDYDIHKEIAKKVRIDNISFVEDPRSNIYELLSITETLLCETSTTVIEALIMGRQPIIIDPYKKGFIDLFGHHDSIISVSTKEELDEQLKKKTRKDKDIKRRDDFIRDHCYMIDGNASKRIAALIDQHRKGR